MQSPTNQIRRSSFSFATFATFLTPLLLVFCRSIDIIVIIVINIIIHLPIHSFGTAKVQEAFGLKSRDFKEIVLNAVGYIFTNEETKTILRERLRAKLIKI